MREAFVSRAAIREVQEQKLRKLLAALETNPFYCETTRGLSSLDDFIARVPFTTKANLAANQLANPPYGTNLTFPLSSYTHFCQTSGTTGTPMRWLDTEESWEWMAGNWIQVFTAAGAKPGDRILFAFSFGPFIGFWTAFTAAQRMGCLAIPTGGMTSQARLHTLQATRATILCCTPTYAIRLGEEAGSMEGLAVKKIIVAGEPGGSIPGTRSHIEDLWGGAKLYDHHGMTETGPVSYECPSRPGVLHVLETAFIAETLETGELVLTNLGRTGSPVLRYRTGDIVNARSGERCACGSFELALEGGILGRTDDMVVVRGVNVFPSAIDDVVRSCGGVAEYRVEISSNRGMSELGLIVEASGIENGLCQRLQVLLRDALGLRVPVKLVPPNSLDRFEMKARRWMRVSH